MNAYTLRQLRTARQRDLVYNEYETERTEAKLAALRAERAQIVEDLDGLNKRMKDEEERNFDDINE